VSNEQRRKNAIRREAVGSDEGEAEAGVVIAVNADVAAAVQDRVLRESQRFRSGYDDRDELWESFVTAITAYKGVHGHVHVANAFVVPASTPWPVETWGTKLGRAVNGIRSKQSFVKGNPERRAWLESTGFSMAAPKAAALRAELSQLGLDTTGTKAVAASSSAH
jgi:hypothetical protein